jgi:hypothetical protein
MTNAVFAAVTLIFAMTGLGRTAGQVQIPWNESNARTLEALTKADVANILNAAPDSAKDLTPGQIDQFRFADLEGNGKYELLLTESGPCASFVMILRQIGGGYLDRQAFFGGANLNTATRDLNGGGKQELIILTPLVSHSCTDIVAWPVVYSLKNGKYVEASRDFPNYYNNEVLPELDQQISKTQAKVAAGKHNYEYRLAGLLMERDQILRVLGRNPTAGLNHAYQWLNSDDPYLLQDAEVTFKEIGGHKAEEQAARDKRVHAICTRYPGTAMCRLLATSGPAANH